jgi:O-antigen ligase
VDIGVVADRGDALTSAGKLYVPGHLQPSVTVPAATSDIATLLFFGLVVPFLIVTSYGAHPLAAFDVQRLTWFAADAFVAATLLLRANAILGMVRSYPILMSWPTLACLSALWSLTPSISLYHGIQFYFTILIGFVLCFYANLERIMQAIVIAMLGAACLSVAYILIIPGAGLWPDGSWMGVFPHKNMLGQAMALLIFTSICLLLQGWRPIISLGGVIAGIGLLLMSRSGVAAIGTCAALAPLPLALAYRRGPVIVTLGIGLGIVAVATLLLGLEIKGLNIYEAALNALGKDSTLTGRTILWEFGIDAYNARPWLGYGFKAWWESPETSATLLRLVIEQNLWFFHNNFLEVLVAFGPIGPILLAAGLLSGLVGAVRRFAMRPQFIELWPVMLICFVILSALGENEVFVNHSLQQVLLVVAIVGRAGPARIGSSAAN